jgi:hypothetical protein
VRVLVFGLGFYKDAAPTVLGRWIENARNFSTGFGNGRILQAAEIQVWLDNICPRSSGKISGNIF